MTYSSRIALPIGILALAQKLCSARFIFAAISCDKEGFSRSLTCRLKSLFNPTYHKCFHNRRLPTQVYRNAHSFPYSYNINITAITKPTSPTSKSHLTPLVKPPTRSIRNALLPKTHPTPSILQKCAFSPPSSLQPRTPSRLHTTPTPKLPCEGFVQHPTNTATLQLSIPEDEFSYQE